MRIRISGEEPATVRRASCLAIVTLVALVSIASPASSTSIGTLPDADVILIFRPQDDHLLSVVEEIVRGEILRIEKGVAPRLIVTPAGTLGPAWRAGVPIRLSLLKFADRDVHYPIFVEPAPPVPKPPEIAVSATDGFVTIHATPAGAPIVMEATLTVPDTSTVRLDVYVGIVPPGGDSLSWVTSKYGLYWPSLTSSTAPVPYIVNFPIYSGTHKLLYRAPAADAQGWHTLYGVIVPPGADPFDPQRWISSSFFPFLVTAPDR